MRLVDADALKRKEQQIATQAWKMKIKASVETVLNQFIDDIDHAPTVDAVRVVRCKDCKYYQFADNRAFGFPVKRCEWTGFEDVDEDDFCSRGERKDGKNGKNGKTD